MILFNILTARLFLYKSCFTPVEQKQKQWKQSSLAQIADPNVGHRSTAVANQRFAPLDVTANNNDRHCVDETTYTHQNADRYHSLARLKTCLSKQTNQPWLVPSKLPVSLQVGKPHGSSWLQKPPGKVHQQPVE